MLEKLDGNFVSPYYTQGASLPLQSPRPWAHVPHILGVFKLNIPSVYTTGALLFGTKTGHKNSEARRVNAFAMKVLC